MGAWLDRLFLLKRGEHGKVLLSVAVLFLTTANLIAIRSARDALILARADIDSLPFLYVVSALFLTLASWLYGLAARRFRRRRLIYLLFLGCGAALIGLFFIARLQRDWFPVFFYVFGEVTVILVSLQGWSFVSEQFDTRQGKRLFGLIATGGILSGACGGFGIQFFSKLFPAEALLLFAAMALFLAVGAAQALARVAGDQGGREAGRDNRAPAPGEGILRLVGANRYLLTITAIFVLTGVGTSFCDYIFKVGVRRHFGGNGPEMASFFGFFYGVSNSIMLLYSLFLSGRVLAGLGVRGAALALPLEILAGCLAALLSPGLLAAAILKFGDTGIRYTLHNSALNLAIMPFSPARRTRIKIFMDGMVRPVASGLAGVVLMVLAAYGGPENLRPYLVFLAGTGLVWVVVTTFLKKGYLRALYDSLAGRRIDLAELSSELADNLTIRVLEGELASADKYRVLYGLGFLTEICPARLPDHYIELLGKWDDQDILAELLPRIEKLRESRFYPALAAKARLCPALAGLFAKAMAASDPGQAQRHIKELLAAGRAGTHLLTAMIRYLDADLAAGARDECRRLAASDREEERAMAAAIIGEAGAGGLETVAERLLHDPAPRIRGLAINAVVDLHGENLALEKLWPAVLDPGSGLAAAAALRKVPGAARCLQAHFEPDWPYEKRLAFMAALAVLRAPESRDFIITVILNGEAALRLKGAVALARIRKSYPGLDFPPVRIQQLLGRELREARLLRAAADHPAARGAARGLLEKEVGVRVEIIFRCLGLLFKQEEVFTTYRNLIAGDRVTNALEFLDSMAEWPGKRDLINLLESDGAGPAPGLTGRPGDELFGALAAMPDRVVQSLALHLAGRRVALAATLRQSEHEVVAEAAVLHLYRLADQAAVGRANAEFIRKKEAGMLSIIERVLFLRGVDIFAGLSGELLLHLAKSAHEEEFRVGAVLVAEDTLVDRNLYIIIEGEVVITKGGREIAVLAGKGCFGEMALLDNRPRSASALAKTECRCLAIGATELKELVTENSGIALGIIAVLSARLRTMLADQLY
jgi:ATP/ADP translocase